MQKKVKGFDMNINDYCMNKTNIKQFQQIQLQIEFADVERLGAFWNNNQLLGIHWRLYHNDTEGAGVILPDGTEVELLPDYIYLIAPYPQLTSFCNATPEHLFVHFILDGCKLSQSDPVSKIPVDETSLFLINKLKKLLKKRPQDSMSQLVATALTSLTLSRLEKKSLSISEIDNRITQACEAMRKAPGYDWSNSELAKRFGFSTNAFTGVSGK